MWERNGREARPLAVYPERLGRYRGAVALFAIGLYSYIALFGMVAFGRETWTERGEGWLLSRG